MNLVTDNIAKKYAIALINVHSTKIKPQCFNSIVATNKFFEKYNSFLMLLSIPTISNKKKQNILEQLFNRYNGCTLLHSLAKSLISSRRLNLLQKILFYFIQLYNKQQNIIEFTVSTSHQLTQEQQSQITQAISKNLTSAPLTSFVINKKLINGIKIRSDNILWEYSVARELTRLKRFILNR